MKLTKISLAALVALGAFSSVASATPLEEAIKNVDMSGFARYRYNNVVTEKKDVSKKSKKTDAGHNFKLVANFKAMIDDNFFGVLGFRYNKTDDSGNKVSAAADRTMTNADSNLGIHQLYLGYKVQNTTITAGKQEIGTFFTDDHIGTGLKVVNQDIQGLTLAAVAFDAMEYSSETDGALLSAAKGYDVGNLYGVAAIGSYDPVAFQLWYATVENVADLLGVEVAGNVELNDDIAFGAKVQYVNTNADSKVTSLVPDYTDGNFYAGELSTSLFGAEVAAGYIGWKADDRKTTSFTLEDNGALLAPGEETFDHTLVKGKANFWYGTVGYTFNEFFVGHDHVQGNIKDAAGDKTKITEVVNRLGYNYSKKLTFTSWYSYLETKKGSSKETQDKFRFEAKYKF